MIELTPTPPRCHIMGVLNVTPDSFSDGGRFGSVEEAVAAGRAMVSHGADVVDVGGESTRPGADRVSPAEEMRRVLPVVRELVRSGAVVSIDTTRAQVARSAVAAGAAMVNDVSGGLADPGMLDTVAELGVPVVIMHWRAPSRTMHRFTDYDDVVTEVAEALTARVAECAAAGIAHDRIVLDPGLGFAKEAHHNWELLRGLDQLTCLGLPVLIGASRKRFLGSLLADGDAPRPVGERDVATAAISAICAAAGVWGVRVHEVSSNLDAVRVGRAWREGGR